MLDSMTRGSVLTWRHVNRTRMAVNYLLKLGGSAYLPIRVIADDVETGKLQVVEDAPKIKHRAYAVYPVRGGKAALIKKILELFEYRVDIE